MAEKANIYRIVYALAPKKVQSFIQPPLVDRAKEQGIDLIPIDFTKPLIDHLPFDCLIHKSTDPEWINQLQQFISQYPEIIVIDNPKAIERVHNRITMLQFVNQLNLSPEATLEVPKQVFVESPEQLSDSVTSKSLNFPVIAKPVVANGSAGSHQMYLVFNQEGLGELELNPPFVLQEFINHGGVIFKVYVAGQHVQCVRRNSLPDISEEKLGVSQNLIPFSQISNVTATDQSDAKLMETGELPPLSFVNEVACQLRQALKLSLFNFDMIRDSRNECRYLVIDINYFPGYAKMPDYETILTDFFLDTVQKQQSAISVENPPLGS